MLAAFDVFDFVIIGAIVLVVALLTRAGRGSTNDAKLRRIDRKIDMLVQHLGIELPETVVSGLSTEVCNLADAGRKIDAIKVHREETGVGLKEAKDAVEEYMER
jgi:ribosomal protein L7/L12